MQKYTLRLKRQGFGNDLFRIVGFPLRKFPDREYPKPICAVRIVRYAEGTTRAGLWAWEHEYYKPQGGWFGKWSNSNYSTFEACIPDIKKMLERKYGLEVIITPGIEEYMPYDDDMLESRPHLRGDYKEP